jgi:hypothetical protein
MSPAEDRRREQVTVDAIKAYFSKHCAFPNYGELAAELCLVSPSSALRRVRAVAQHASSWPHGTLERLRAEAARLGAQPDIFIALAVVDARNEPVADVARATTAPIGPPPDFAGTIDKLSDGVSRLRGRMAAASLNECPEPERPFNPWPDFS